MPKYQHKREGRTPTGAKFIPHYKVKKRHALGGEEVLVILGEKENKKIERTYGGNKKIRILSAAYCNVFDGKEYKKVKILDVVENKAHPLFERRKIITKGAIIKTEIGLVKVTSRPSQHGIINGVLVEKKG